MIIFAMNSFMFAGIRSTNLIIIGYWIILDLKALHEINLEDFPSSILQIQVVR